MKNKTDKISVSGRLLARLSIRRKLILIIMFISSMVIVLACSIFIFYEWYTFRQQMVSDLLTVAEMIGDNCTGALSFDDPTDAAEVLHSLRAKTPIEFACVYRKDGTVLAVYQRDRSMPIETVAAREGEGFEFHQDRLVSWGQIILNDRYLGSVYLRSDLSELSAFLTQSFVTGMLMLLLSCIIAYILASRLQAVISRPILSLSKITADVTETQDYSIRAEKQTDDETGLLIDSFNNMLTKIQHSSAALIQSEEKLRRITDNLQESFVYQHDVEGNFNYVSSSVTKVLGYSPEEFLGHFATYLTENFVTEEVRRHTELSIKGIQQSPYEVQIYHKGGDIRWLEVAEAPVRDNSGAVIAVEGIAHDITERKEAEEKIKQQLDELQRWHDVMLGREDRNRELKREVNELLEDLGKSVRYPSEADSK